MSETVEFAPAPAEVPMTLDQFARTLRPRRTVDPRTQQVRVLPGEPDEVWLKLLRMKHGRDKRTLAQWKAAIDQYRDLPAHPTVVGA